MAPVAEAALHSVPVQEAARNRRMKANGRVGKGAWHNVGTYDAPSWRRAHASPDTHIGTRGHGAPPDDRVCRAFTACAPIARRRRALETPLWPTLRHST